MATYLPNILGIIPYVGIDLAIYKETRLWSLDQEDSLEKEMATHSSILAWRIPRTEEPGGYNPWGHKESDMTEQLSAHIHTRSQSPRKLTHWLKDQLRFSKS